MNAIRNRFAIRSRLLKLVSSYRQGARPNIAIFAMRRGGSTLLGDMLSSERGVLSVNEPLNVLEEDPTYKIRTRWLKPRMHSTYFDLDEEDGARVREYMSRLLAGKVPIGVARFPKVPFRSDRMLLKILFASALLDWLADSFNLQVVRLLRHPAPQALSVLRKKWGFPVEAFFERPSFLLGFLREEQVEYGRRIIAESSPWKMAILDWCIEYHLLVHYTRKKTPLIAYEELVIDPATTCRFLCDYLALDDFERIVACVRKPSTSVGGCSADNVTLIHSGDTQSLIQSWRKKVDADMSGQAQEILDRFDVAIYNMGSPLPDARLAGVGASRHATTTETPREAAPSPAGVLQ